MQVWRKTCLKVNNRILKVSGERWQGLSRKKRCYRFSERLDIPKVRKPHWEELKNVWFLQFSGKITLNFHTFLDYDGHPGDHSFLNFWKASRILKPSRI